MSRTYRGYVIVLADDIWSVYKHGELVDIAKTEEAAMAWVDAQRLIQPIPKPHQ